MTSKSPTQNINLVFITTDKNGVKHQNLTCVILTYVMVKLYKVTPSHSVPSNSRRYNRLTSLSQPLGGTVVLTTLTRESVRFDVMELFTADWPPAVAGKVQAGMW